jgi:hypothetical protein
MGVIRAIRGAELTGGSGGGGETPAGSETTVDTLTWE